MLSMAPAQATPSSLATLGPALALCMLAWLYYSPSTQLTSSRLFRFMLIFNAITVQSCLDNWLDCLVMGALVTLVTWGDQGKMWWVVGVAVGVAVVQPGLGPCLCVLVYTAGSGQAGRNRSLFVYITMAVLACLCLAMHLSPRALASHASPHLGPAWLLPPHLFHSRLPLYQTLLPLAPYLLLAPLLLTRSRPCTQLCIALYGCLYFLDRVTHAHILGLYWLQALQYWQVMGQCRGRKRVVWGVVSVVGAVVSVGALVGYARVLELWLGTHLVSVGYLMVQGLLFWGAHAVYLAEALTMLDPEGEKEEQGKKREKLTASIWKYFRQRLECI